jgi:FkbH-like protein
MKTFSQLKKNLKGDLTNLKKVKIALLGDTATQFLVQAIRGWGVDELYDLEIWEADFNQIESQVFNPSSELFKFEPEFVIIFQSSHKLLGKYNKLRPTEQGGCASIELEMIQSITSSILENLEAKVIYYNYSEIDDSVFGNFASKTTSSFLFQIRKLNYDLMVYAQNLPDLFLCDLSSIQNQIGKKTLFQPSVYVNTETVLSLEVLPIVASKTVALVRAIRGSFKKCLILDLDNTTWGGIIGDDGIENIEIGNLGIGKAFTEFQYWVKQLKQRGIILAVCSKNNESIAKEPFEKHPDMILRLEDIAVFVANWENKVDNIRSIQNVLNIGYDSMVFLDDNPFERNMVRESISEICVPEMPEDPAEYLEYLYGLNLFETSSHSREDQQRTELYRVEAERKVTRKKFSNQDDFLKSLNMVSVVESFNIFNTPRIAQLSQRSNQFNLRTIRYSAGDIEKISVSKDYYTFTFTLDDKFGENGLICVIILKKESDNALFIDTWLMSCRVLKRGMENYVLNTIAKFAKKGRFTYLKGEYISSSKNALVKNHYQDLGFGAKGDFWVLELDNYREKPALIKTKQSRESSE